MLLPHHYRAPSRCTYSAPPRRNRTGEGPPGTAARRRKFTDLDLRFGRTRPHFHSATVCHVNRRQNLFPELCFSVPSILFLQITINSEVSLWMFHSEKKKKMPVTMPFTKMIHEKSKLITLRTLFSCFRLMETTCFIFLTAF